MENLGKEFLKIISNLFLMGSEKITLSNRILNFTIVLFIIIITNNIFLFTHNYRINEKISQIEKIENIQYKFKVNSNEINDLKKEVYENDSIFTYKNILEIYDRGYSFIKNKINILDNNKESNQYNFYSKEFLWFFISIEFIWIIMFVVGVFLLFSKEDRKNSLFALLGVIIIAFIWYYIFIFINGLVGMKSNWGNVLYNIVIIAILIKLFGKKNIPKI